MKNSRRHIYNLRRARYLGMEPPPLPTITDHRQPAKRDDKAQKTIEKQNQHIKHLQEQFIRLRAEFENFRQRAKREQEKVEKYAAEDLIKKLIVVMDDINRALESARTSDNVEAIASGVEIIREHFWAQLEAAGVEPIPTDGQPFDPNVHEAVSMEASDDIPDNHVVTTLQPGYKLNDRVIRAAMVTVCKK